MSYPTLSFSWQISGPPEAYIYDNLYPDFRYANVAFPGNPFASVANITLYSYAPYDTEDDVTFYSTNGSLYDFYGFANLSVPQGFYAGPQSDPVFLPGTYQAGFEYHDYTLYDGTLTVTDLTSTSTVTPEASTLALLGTGLLGAAELRRRLIRN